MRVNPSLAFRFATSTSAFAAAVGAFLLLSACAGIGSSAARAQDAAQELNLNTRFGRMELVVESVAAKEREAFLSHHKGWGAKIRVADTELSGFHMTADSEAEVGVKVSWYRQDEGELRITMLRQKWESQKGDWKLVSEERSDGDIGLLGENVVIQTPDEPRAPAQFPTIRIGAVD